MQSTAGQAAETAETVVSQLCSLEGLDQTYTWPSCPRVFRWSEKGENLTKAKGRKPRWSCLKVARHGSQLLRKGRIMRPYWRFLGAQHTPQYSSEDTMERENRFRRAFGRQPTWGDSRCLFRKELGQASAGCGETGRAVVSGRGSWKG